MQLREVISLCPNFNGGLLLALHPNVLHGNDYLSKPYYGPANLS